MLGLKKSANGGKGKENFREREGIITRHVSMALTPKNGDRSFSIEKTTKMPITGVRIRKERSWLEKVNILQMIGVTSQKYSTGG